MKALNSPDDDDDDVSRAWMRENTFVGSARRRRCARVSGGARGVDMVYSSALVERVGIDVSRARHNDASQPSRGAGVPCARGDDDAR